MIYSCSSDHQSQSSESNSQTLFVSKSSDHTGITFNNKLTENLSTGENILDFDFFFNGAGLAIADFDNDGLDDIFFAGNQVDNRIYKNEGGFTFSDLTESSGINPSLKKWCTGVSCADVNQDGLIDIYVSQGGPYSPELRQNLLLINKGNFRFSNEAQKYGLADTGISSHAAFFDYDKDGDLDCIVMNESPLIGFDPVKFYTMISQHSSSLLHKNSSHLYRNDNGQYTDVSEETGLLRPSFGLGLCVSDINNDNWLDIYIANDYYIPDAIYLNDKKGGFIDSTKELIKHSSFFSMGIDIADIDNDGHQDIYVLDMANADHIKSKTLMASMNVRNFELLTKDFDFPYQYMFNAMQLNDGNNTFNNISHLSGTAKTDWSWAGLIEDFDLDGHKEIFVSNGYRKYTKDNDFQNRVTALKQKYKGGEIPIAEKEAIYATVPSEKTANVFFKQKVPYMFEDIADRVGLDESSFSNGAAFSDLDNDGDLDLVVNNIDSKAFVYENTADKNSNNYLKVEVKSELSESFPKVKIYYDSKVQISEIKKVRGYLSSQPGYALFGLGEINKVDSLIVKWSNGKQQLFENIETNQTIVLSDKESTVSSRSKKESKSVFNQSSSLLSEHKENGYNDFLRETLLPYKQSVTGPNVKVFENGKTFISGSLISPALLLNKDKSVAFKFTDTQIEVVDAIMFDLENDGDQDIYLIAGGNESDSKSTSYDDQLWLNKNGTFVLDTGQGRLNSGASGKTGRAIDFDKDGDQDLIICNRIVPKRYPQHAGSILFQNDNGKLRDVTTDLARSLNDFGIINDIEVLDFNNDGWMDFMVVGEWTGIGLFQNNEGSFENVSESFGLDDKLGWWFSITPTDVNGDDKKDYIIGNLGLNSKYKASEKKPLSIYGLDFDENGSFDQVLSYTYKGKEVPFRGRQCSSEQMPFIAEKFKSYESFANASLQEVYGEGLNSATRKQANNFASIALIRSDNGFKIFQLPIASQFHPIMDGISLDIDNNGFEDVILIGNLYETEVETPRLDFSNATVLLSNGNEFTFNKELSKQMRINGNAKSIDLLKDSNGLLKILLGVNNEGVKEYTVQ